MFGSDTSSGLALLVILPFSAQYRACIMPSLQGERFLTHLSLVGHIPWGVTGPVERHNHLDLKWLVGQKQEIGWRKNLFSWVNYWQPMIAQENAVTVTRVWHVHWVPLNRSRPRSRKIYVVAVCLGARCILHAGLNLGAELWKELVKESKSS